MMESECLELLEFSRNPSVAQTSCTYFVVRYQFSVPLKHYYSRKVMFSRLR